MAVHRNNAGGEESDGDLVTVACPLCDQLLFVVMRSSQFVIPIHHMTKIDETHVMIIDGKREIVDIVRRCDMSFAQVRIR